MYNKNIQLRVPTTRKTKAGQINSTKTQPGMHGRRKKHGQGTIVGLDVKTDVKNTIIDAGKSSMKSGIQAK